MTSDLGSLLVCNNGSRQVVEKIKYEDVTVYVLNFVPDSKCSVDASIISHGNMELC